MVKQLTKESGQGLVYFFKTISILALILTIKVSEAQIVKEIINSNSDIYIEGEVHYDINYFFKKGAFDKLINNCLLIDDTIVNEITKSHGVLNFIREEPVSKEIFYSLFFSNRDSSLIKYYENSKLTLGKLENLKKVFNLYKIPITNLKCIDIEYRNVSSDALSALLGILLILPFENGKNLSLLDDLKNNYKLDSNFNQLNYLYPQTKLYYFVEELLRLQKHDENDWKNLFKITNNYTDSTFYKDSKELLKNDNYYDILKRLIENILISYKQKQPKKPINNFREAILFERVLKISNSKNGKTFLNIGMGHVTSSKSYTIYKQLVKEKKVQAINVKGDTIKNQNKGIQREIIKKEYGFDINLLFY